MTGKYMLIIRGPGPWNHDLQYVTEFESTPEEAEAKAASVLQSFMGDDEGCLMLEDMDTASIKSSVLVQLFEYPPAVIDIDPVPVWEAFEREAMAEVVLREKFNALWARQRELERFPEAAERLGGIIAQLEADITKLGGTPTCHSQS